MVVRQENENALKRGNGITVLFKIRKGLRQTEPCIRIVRRQLTQLIDTLPWPFQNGQLPKIPLRSVSRTPDCSSDEMPYQYLGCIRQKRNGWNLRPGTGENTGHIIDLNLVAVIIPDFTVTQMIA